jgi:FkbM family methyltransferase
MSVSATPDVNLFRPLGLGAVLDRHPMACLDIGSRGGFEPDLGPIAFAVDAVGFEPEPEAFARLADQPIGAWRSLRHLPSAIGAMDGEQMLHITRDPVSTSLLCPDPSIGEAFAKPQFFEVMRTVPVACRTLDTALAEAGISSPAYLKIDVEGAELDILKAAPATLSSLLAIKAEVGFLRFRHHQPIAAEIELFLRGQGFELLDFISPRRWRIQGYVIHPQAGDGAVPYSRGRLMQGDYLFLRDPDTVAEPQRLFQLAVLAMAHGFFDHALAILSRPPVAAWLGQPPEPLVAEASRAYGRMVWRQSVMRHLRLLWTYGRSALNLFLK